MPNFPRPLLRESLSRLALGFGANSGEALAAAQASLKKGFDAARKEYEQGWRLYVSSSNPWNSAIAGNTKCPR